VLEILLMLEAVMEEERLTLAPLPITGEINITSTTPLHFEEDSYIIGAVQFVRETCSPGLRRCWRSLLMLESNVEEKRAHLPSRVSLKMASFIVLNSWPARLEFLSALQRASQDGARRFCIVERDIRLTVS
jgi:hypothetical protein